MLRARRRGEVGTVDLLIMRLVFFGGLVIAVYVGNWLGNLWFFLGLPLGVAIAFGVLYLGALLWACLEALFCDGMPYLPTCGNGKCRSGLLTDFGDYEPEEVGGQWGYFRCRCGRLYWRRREEGRVLEVLPDGTVEPYMVWKAFRGWYHDKEMADRKEAWDEE